MEEYYLMWLSRIDGIGFKRANYLLEHFGSAEAIWHAESETIKRIPAIPEKITNLLLASRKEELLKQMMAISYKSDVSKSVSPYYVKIKKYTNTTTPSTIRYTPKAEKECFLTYSISARMTRRETIKLTTLPTISTAISVPVMPTPVSRNFRPLMAEAPSMVGLAIKKENSLPALRLTPSKIAPRMVEPDREVPGIRLRH